MPVVILRAVAIALAIALCALGVQTWRLDRLQTAVAKAEAENAQLSANLTTQRDAVRDMQRLAEKRAAEAKKAKAEAQALRRQNESRAQRILSLPKPAGDECAAASELIRRELGK